MFRHAGLIGLFLITILFSACKKDMLQFRNVQQLNSNTTDHLNNICFLNDSICIAGGGESFYRSTALRSADGGYTWSVVNVADAPKEMYGMGISVNGNIYLSGIDGDVIHSGDNGRTWQVDRIGNWLVYRGGLFVTPDTGIFVSSVLQRQSTITRVHGNFQIIDTLTYLFGLNNIYMTDANTGYVVGYGVVMKTNDRGNSWAYQDVQGDNFTAMAFYGNNVWMCGSNGGIYHTTDGGNNWQVLRNGNDLTLPRFYLRSLVFKDTKHGWAVGDEGKVIYTNDGGKHWSEYDRFTTSTLRSVVICPNGDLLMAGDNGALYRIRA